MRMQNIVHKNSLYLLSTVIRYKINYIMISMRPAAASIKIRNSPYNYSIHYIIAHQIHSKGLFERLQQKINLE